MSPHQFGYYNLLATNNGGMKIRDPGDGGTFHIDKSGGVAMLTVGSGSETRLLPAPSSGNGIGVGTVLYVAINSVDGGGLTITDTASVAFAISNTGAVLVFTVVEIAGVKSWIGQQFLTGVTSTSSELNILDGVTATTAEINRACDVSTRLVAAGSTESVVVATHDGKTVLLDTAGGSVCTLPVAAGTGARVRFVVTVRPSGGSHVIKVGNASDFLAGQIHMLDLDSNAATAYLGDGAADDTITINNTTTGGAIGDSIELEDTLANVWTVIRGSLSVPTGSNVADPFSATV